jgi:hypothetical protein
MPAQETQIMLLFVDSQLSYLAAAGIKSTAILHVTRVGLVKHIDLAITVLLPLGAAKVA